MKNGFMRARGRTALETEGTWAHLRHVSFTRTVSRLIATLSLVVACSGSATGQVNVVHITSCGPATFPGTNCTIPSTGSGNLIVVGWEIGGGANTATTISTISDNVGNTYVEAGAARAIDASAGSVADIWYARNSVAGATSIAITPSTTVTNAGVVVWEFAGIDTTAPLDATAVLDSQATSATPLGAQINVSAASYAIISLAIVGANITGILSGNPFTNDSALKGNGWAHVISSSAGTYYAQWNQNPAGTYASSTVSFKAASSATYSACDLNKDSQTNVVDSQLSINMYLGLTPCTATVDGPGVCNQDVVQKVETAALGGTCVVTPPPSHSVTLNWTGSTSSNINGYNVYRSTVSGGPYTKINLSLVAATSHADSNVQAGQTYYYVATAVDINNNESVYSNQAQAGVPTP